MSLRVVCMYDGKESTFTTDKSRIVIGRSKPGIEIDVDLAFDKTVSRPHAVVSAVGRQLWVEDLNSTGGTLVNGEEIKGTGPREVRRGDIVVIGNTTLHVSVEEPGPSEMSHPTAEDGGHITETVDATASLFSPALRPSDAMNRRLALLYDLPLQLGAEARFEAVLQTIVERLVEVIPYAAGAALLVLRRDSNELLLKAHVPPGRPAVSLRLAHQAMERRHAFLWRRGTSPDLTAAFDSAPVESALYAPLLWKDDVLGVLCTVNYDPVNVFSEDDLRLTVAVAQHAAMALLQRVTHDDLRVTANLLTRLMINFSPKVRERLLSTASTGRPHLGGQKSEVTILITDIRGFTNLAASMDAEDVVDMLNDYFSALIEVAFKFDGTVDKFIGDAVLVVFGSPEPDTRQHEKAVRAAIEMQEAVRAVTAVRARRNQITCEMGIALHCGEVLHGFIGSSDRMEFTVIGDAVNRATRYCQAAGPGEIIMSPQMHEWVWRLVHADPVDVPMKHGDDEHAFRVRATRSLRT